MVFLKFSIPCRANQGPAIEGRSSHGEEELMNLTCSVLLVLGLTLPGYINAGDSPGIAEDDQKVVGVVDDGCPVDHSNFMPTSG